MAEKTLIKVWDIAVRIFHWSLVLLFFAAYLSGDGDNALHVYAGYGVLALVAFRLVWGFIGTKHARFTDFVRGPTAVLQYLRSIIASRPLHYLGHNPLGGWMVIALLLSLTGTCWSGLEAYGEKGHGPFALIEFRLVSPALADDDEAEERRDDSEERDADESEEGDEFWEEIHESFSNFTLFLVFLHVAGALASSAIHRENLVKSMITGYKSPPAP
jgi:cytochrome b